MSATLTRVAGILISSTGLLMKACVPMLVTASPRTTFLRLGQLRKALTGMVVTPAGTVNSAKPAPKMVRVRPVTFWFARSVMVKNA